MNNADLKRRTFLSVVWTAVRVASTNGMSFVVFSVLARILSPHDFGIFALASLLVEFTRVVSSVGLGDAVVRSKTLDLAFADTAFWANVLLGCCVGAIVWATAPLYAAVVRQAEVTQILRWLAILVPISSLGGIHTARMLREFGHKAMAVRVVTGGMIGGIAAVAAALDGWGVSSLVVQATLTDLIGLIFAWQSYPWRPRFRFHGRLLAEVFGFSASMMLTQVMFLMLARVQDIVISRFVSAAGLGIYRVAWRMVDLIVQTTIQPMVSVAVITLAQVQDDGERFQSVYLRMLALGALFTFPALFGIGVVSDEIIALLFGPSWAGASDIMKILVLLAVPITLNYFGGQALAALGRASAIAKVATLQATMTLIFSLLAAPYGLRCIAAAYVLRAYLTMPYQLVQLRRATGISCTAMLFTVGPPFVASLVMVGLLTALRPMLADLINQPMRYISIMTLLGCVSFLITLRIVGYDYLQTNLQSLLSLWRASTPGGISPRQGN